MKKSIREAEVKEIRWEDFSDPVTDEMENKYLPSQGEGDNMATQAVTAVTKIIYRWFNDGDVFDNTYGLEGFANNLSSYANWLHENIPEAAVVLSGIEEVGGRKKAYTKLLFDLEHAVLVPEVLAKYEAQPATGTVYDCEGPYEFYEAPTCPYCGNECDEYDLDHYGMCYDCYQEQQAEEEEFDESRKVSDKKSLTEGQLSVRQARQMAARRGSQNAIGFEAHDLAGMKQGLALMKRQLRDMQANPNRYIQALESGFVIAGFGGDLPGGIEVPETLMTGEVPPGMTAEQAFRQVVEYMQQVIAECSKTALPGSKASLSKPAAGAIEDKRIAESRRTAKKSLKEGYRIDYNDQLKIAEARVRKAKRELKELKGKE